MARRIASLGTQFENALQATNAAYLAAGLAYLEKVEPPTKVLHIKGRSPMTVHLANPFLDFVGTWTEMGGKVLMVECKYTTEPILAIQEQGGIKLKQLRAALRWERSGAAVAFLWRREDQTRLVTPRMCQAQLLHRKSLRWCDAHPVPAGPGFILIDFLALLRQLHKPKPTITTPPQ